MQEIINQPIKLKGESVWRTYIGGREIRKLHGDCNAKDDHFPEEWMYSITQARNAGRENIEEGLCKVADDPTLSLKKLVETYPIEMLGAKHVAKWGNTTGVLIKILDSLERLTIQVHPNKKKAQELFHSQFGKTECWYILETRNDLDSKPCIYLGFKEGIQKEEWQRCFKEQDINKMLALLNRIEVNPKETYLVKGGVPHAIGSGCLIMEIQEPTDYTIRVEKVTPSGFEICDSMCHQGLGFEKMFACFDYLGQNVAEIKNKYGMKAKNIPCDFGVCKKIIDYEETSCFKIIELEINKIASLKSEGVFSCLYLLSNNGILKTIDKEYQLKKNDQFFIPALSSDYQIIPSDDKPVKLLMMYGPQA